MIPCKRIKIKRMWKDRLELARWLPKGGVGIELGVYHGKCAKYLCDHAKPTKLYCIDLWQPPNTVMPERWEKRYRTTLKTLSSEIGNGVVEVLRMDTAEASSKFEDESVDWVHGDSGVLYDHIRANIFSYWPKIRSGGYLGIRGFTPSNPVNGVHIAIDEAREQFGDIEIVGLSNDTDCSRTIVLRRS